MLRALKQRDKRITSLWPLTLVKLTRENPELDPQAVLHLENRLYIYQHKGALFKSVFFFPLYIDIILWLILLLLAFLCLGMSAKGEKEWEDPVKGEFWTTKHKEYLLSCTVCIWWSVTFYMGSLKCQSFVTIIQ